MHAAPVDLDARVSGTGPSDDERWTSALAQVARRTPRTVEATRRGPRQLTWLLALVGVLVALSLLLLALQPWRGEEGWQQTVAWVAATVLVVLCLCGAVVAWGSGTLRNSWLDVQSQLTRAQRRQVAAELRGAAPLEPVHVPLVREWALRQAAQLPMTLVAVGLQQFRVADPDSSGAFRWISLAVFGVWLGSLGWFVVEVRRVRRFLRAHPEPVRG